MNVSDPARSPSPLPFVRPISEGGQGGVVCAPLSPAAEAARLPFALDTVAWRKERSLLLTVVVKVCLSLRSSPMPAADVAPRFQSRDAHDRNQPMQHVVDASDRIPWKNCIDVTALGSACAPRGVAVPEMIARLAVLSDAAVLLDKRVRVVGSRASGSDAPAPFTRMPVVYGRAFGGPSTSDNPIGTGDDPSDELPSILDLTNPLRPAGFGPISMAWPSRQRLLKEIPRRLLDGLVMELPRGFDWGYFQSAPADQQLEELPQGAVFVLEGFDAERPRIEVELPDVQVAGAVFGLDMELLDAAVDLMFRLDTLHFDTDAGVCHAVYRAYIDVPDEASLGRLLVVAGAGIGEGPAVPSERPPVEVPPPAAAPAPERTPTGTVALRTPTGTMEIPSVRPPASLPFEKDSRVSEPPAEPSPRVPPTLQPAAPVAYAAAGVITPRVTADPQNRLPPEGELTLERYARLAAALADSGAGLLEALRRSGVEPEAWAAAEQRWRRALDEEARRGRHALRERYDDAFVEAWERAHPDRFSVVHYIRLVRAEERGGLSAELLDQKLDPLHWMRLRRVWRRRVAIVPAFKERYEREMASSRPEG